MLPALRTGSHSEYLGAVGEYDLEGLVSYLDDGRLYLRREFYHGLYLLVEDKFDLTLVGGYYEYLGIRLGHGMPQGNDRQHDGLSDTASAPHDDFPVHVPQYVSLIRTVRKGQWLVRMIGVPEEHLRPFYRILRYGQESLFVRRK